jgi:hypothetical protein
MQTHVFNKFCFVKFPILYSVQNWFQAELFYLKAFHFTTWKQYFIFLLFGIKMYIFLMNKMYLSPLK